MSVGCSRNDMHTCIVCKCDNMSIESLSLLLAAPVHVIHVIHCFYPNAGWVTWMLSSTSVLMLGVTARVRTRSAVHHFTWLASECMQLVHLSLSASYVYLINRLSSL